MDHGGELSGSPFPSLRRAYGHREGGEEAMAIQLKLKKGESVERGLKRLKKILDKEGLIKTLRETRYFEKPCVKARKKSARARIRARSRRRMAEM